MNIEPGTPNDDVLRAVENLRLLVLDTKASQAQAMDDLDTRIDGLSREMRLIRDEMQASMRSYLLATTNELAAMDARWDRRYRQVEDRLAALERR